uniref:extracellular calcium-sensing receptor-like n=1 Tax=Myxine glutinosa TaxID=7769 RepID=UPI00358E6E3C
MGCGTVGTCAGGRKSESFSPSCFQSCSTDETWTLTKDLRQRLNSFSTRSLQRTIGYCWSDFCWFLFVLENAYFLQEHQLVETIFWVECSLCIMEFSMNNKTSDVLLHSLDAHTAGTHCVPQRRAVADFNVTQFELWTEIHLLASVIPSSPGGLQTRLARSDFNLYNPDGQDRLNVFSERALRWSLAMVFAMQEINKQTDLLPNISLGYVIFDTCLSQQKVVETAIGISGQFLLYREDGSCHTCAIKAIIGPASTSLSISVSRILQFLHIPLVSYYASCKCLSDKREFPSLLRTIPSDTYQASVMVHLVRHFRWVYIGTIQHEDDYGRSGMGQFLAEAEQENVCIAFRESLPIVEDKTIHRQIAEITKGSKAQVLILFTLDKGLAEFAEELLNFNVTARTWIASEGWSSSASLGIPRFYPIFQGTIGIAIRHGYIPGFREFLLNLKPQPDNIMMSQYTNHSALLDERKHKYVTSSLNCEGTDTEYNEKQLCTGHEQLVHANTVLTDVSELRATYNSYIAVYTVAHALQDLHMCTPGFGPFTNASCATIFYYKPWQLLFYQKMVRFVSNVGEQISFDENGDPPAVYDIVSWQVDASGTLSFPIVGSFDSSASPEKKLHIDTSGIFWTAQRHIQVPNSVCNEHCVHGTRKIVRRGEPFCCFDCIPCANGEYSNETDAHVIYNKTIKQGIIILECTSNSSAWASCALGYLGILVIICLGLVIRTQRQKSTIHEPKYITFSMISCLLVFLAFVPAYSSTQGKLKVATKIFAINAAAYGLLGCIFVPKCYIIVVKTKQQSRICLKGGS